MQATAIIEVLSRALSADAARFEAVESRDGMPTIYAPLDHLVETCRVLRDAPGAAVRLPGGRHRRRLSSA